MNFDIAIIGGGVVGCACFSHLIKLGKKCVLIEKESDVATGMSKANSGLVHAGFDCKVGTLKAQLNVRGNELFENLCKELSVPFKRTGAVVVGNDLEKIKELYNQGLQNGVKELFIIQDEELHSIVPNLSENINYGLYAKTAGIVSPYLLTIALAEEGVINGGKVEFNFFIKEIIKENDYFIISNGKKKIKSKIIINASGKGYNDIASLLNAENYPLSFRKGEYFVLDRETEFVNLSVFPLPTKLGKGILATPTVAGNILFGPTAEEEKEYSTATTTEGLDKIKNFINSNYKNIPWNKVIREYTGVRVSSGDDFIIEKSKVKNVINICGINSPGLSCVPAIAEYVANLLGLNNVFVDYKKRVPYTRIQKLSIEDANQIIKENHLFGKIVCRCEKISEGEIIEVLRSPLKPKTIDAVKRRARAGMGRCQGGFCTMKICELISKEFNIPMEKVLKEYAYSNICSSDIKQTKYFKEKK